MAEFCVKCGTKIESGYQFCPKCGNKIENLHADALPNSEQQGSILICDNCGEENDIDNKLCSYCGISLKNSSETKTHSHTSKKIKDKKQTAHSKNQQAAKEAKNLDKKTTLLILSGIIIACLLVLIFSGILNKPEVSNKFADSQNQNSGVNLNSIKKINELEAKLKANPKDDETLLELAHLKNDSGFYQQAIINYTEYLERHKEDADARIDMGVCYYNLGNFNKAIDEMKEALKYAPEHQIGYLNLGIVNLAIGKTEESKKWLEGALKINPNTEAGKKAEEVLKTLNNEGGN